MLVLSRKKNQSIIINHNIEIQVLQISGNRIRLGISAPKEVQVVRSELKPFGVANDNGGYDSDRVTDSRQDTGMRSLPYTAQAG